MFLYASRVTFRVGPVYKTCILIRASLTCQMPSFTCCADRFVARSYFSRVSGLPVCHRINVHVLGTIFLRILERSLVFFRVGFCRQFIFPFRGIFSHYCVALFCVANPTYYICFRGRKIPWIFLCNQFWLLRKLVREIFCREALLFNPQVLFRASFELVVNWRVDLGCFVQPLVFLVAIEMHVQVLFDCPQVA